MGRKRRNLTIENLKNRLLVEIDNEHDPDRLNSLLEAFIKVERILETRQKVKEEKKLALPRRS